MSRYHSHLQVLASVLAANRPERVLEYGAGHHSTPLFLARKELKQLVSVEVDLGWREVVEEKYADPRLRVLPKGNPIPSNFDLVFIDDGTHRRDRMRTIRAVLSRPHPIVVIHDCEVPEYAALIDEYSTNYTVFPSDPDTAVLSATN